VKGHALAGIAIVGALAAIGFGWWWFRRRRAAAPAEA
jgi:hypothetical protein